MTLTRTASTPAWAPALVALAVIAAACGGQEPGTASPASTMGAHSVAGSDALGTEGGGTIGGHTLAPRPSTTTVPAGPGGGTLADPSRAVRVDLPEGVVASEVDVTLGRVDPEDWDAVTAALEPKAVYDVAPSDLHFSQPVRVSLDVPTSEADVSGDTAGALVPLRRDGDAWHLLSGVGTEVREATTVVAADTTRLGRFAVVLVQVRSASYAFEHGTFDGATARMSVTVQLTPTIFGQDSGVLREGPFSLRGRLDLAGGEPSTAVTQIDERGVARLDFGVNHFGTYRLDEAELLSPTGEVFRLNVDRVEPIQITP